MKPIMTKKLKHILDRYVCLSSLISLPIWFVTHMLVNFAFGPEKVLLLSFTVGGLNWYFLMIHIDICSSSIRHENKIGDILFTIYVTILLMLSIYVIYNYWSTIVNSFISK